MYSTLFVALTAINLQTYLLLVVVCNLVIATNCQDGHIDITRQSALYTVHKHKFALTCVVPHYSRPGPMLNPFHVPLLLQQ